MSTASDNLISKDKTLRADLAMSGLAVVLLIPVLYMVFSGLDSYRPAGARTQSVIGKLTHSINSVRRRLDGMLVWNEISTAAPIYQKDAVYAGTDSEAVISLEDGSRIVLDENSMAVIHSLVRADETSDPAAKVVVDVVRGSASGEARGRELSIRAGKARLALKKGSRARIRMGQSETARIDVVGGKALIETEGKSAQEVSAGQRGQIDRDGQLSTRKLPVALLAPADGERIFFSEQAPAVEFRWQSQEASKSCLFELSRDTGFDGIRESRQTSEPAVKLTGLEAGSYYWRVRCGDKPDARLISLERKLSLIVDAAPVLYRPRPDELVYLPGKMSLLFAWSRVADVNQYVIELTRGEELVVKKELPDPSYLHEGGLAEGHYCYRVRSLDPERSNPPWSESTCFRVINRPVPRAPRLFDPKVEVVPADEEPEEPPKGSWLWSLFGGVAHAAEKPTRAIVLRWEEVPGISTYILEIAEDPDFNNVIVRERVPHNYFRWRTLTHRTYYWRVKSVDAEGRPGQFGKAKIIGAVVGGPAPMSPRKGAEFALMKTAAEIELKWTGSELLASYIVQISRDESFSEILESRTVRRTSKMVYQTSRPGKFHWRVIGVDLNGRKSKPGRRSQFVVRLDPPVAIRPADRSLLSWKTEDFRAQLKWSARPVKGYQVQVAGNSRFRKALTRSTTKTTLLHRPKRMGTLYWRVRCQEPESDWSRTYQFQMLPETPRLLSPETGTVIQMSLDSAAVELRWQPVARAAAYLVEVKRSGESSAGKKETLRVDKALTTLENLPSGRFEWSVRALDAEGVESQPGQAGWFELRAPGLPAAPRLSVPAHGDEITVPAERPVALSWQPVELAVSYDMELSAAKEFTETLARQTVAGTQAEVSVPSEKKVYWRVRARNQAGRPGEWSASREFTYRVIPPPPPKPEIVKPLPPVPPALHLAPHLSFFYNLGAVSTMRYGIELSYRLPVWERRLAVALLASYYTATASASESQAGLAAESRVHEVPLELSIAMRLPTTVVDPYLGAGLNVNISHALVSMETQPELRQTDVDFGFVAIGGLEMALGPGAAFIEVRYALATKSKQLVEIDPGGLTFGAGYRIGIW